MLHRYLTLGRRDCSKPAIVAGPHSNRYVRQPLTTLFGIPTKTHLFVFFSPQGGRHTVVRWIHRSRFRIRPNPFTNAPIPIPGTLLTIDPGWYGHVIVETEGTNEGLADLQERCKGNGFPPRAGAPQNKTPSKVYRLLRERRYVAVCPCRYYFS